MGRNFGTRPSVLLGINDPATAFDFDLASTTRLRYFDIEEAETSEGAMIEKLLTGGGSSGGAPSSASTGPLSFGKETLYW